MALALLLLGPAGHVERHPAVDRERVLTGQPRPRPLPGTTEALAVDQQALLSPGQVHDDPAERSVRERLEYNAKPIVDGAHPGNGLDVHLALEIEDEIGQVVFGRPQVDLPRPGL